MGPRGGPMIRWVHEQPAIAKAPLNGEDHGTIEGAAFGCEQMGYAGDRRCCGAFCSVRVQQWAGRIVASKCRYERHFFE
jgi:hypothetical protein